VYSHAFLSSALHENEKKISHPACFTPKARASSTHQIGGRMEPRASLDTVVAKRKIPDPPGNQPPVIQSTSSYFTN